MENPQWVKVNKKKTHKSNNWNLDLTLQLTPKTTLGKFLRLSGPVLS